jgi:hypothetical protein
MFICFCIAATTPGIFCHDNLCQLLATSVGVLLSLHPASLVTYLIRLLIQSQNQTKKERKKLFDLYNSVKIGSARDRTGNLLWAFTNVRQKS